MARLLGLAAVIAATAASAGEAATVIVFTDPMTLERRIVVRDTPGPDRAYLCMLPPSQAGCTRLDLRRALF